jgi:predicted phosphodiesterase
MMRILIVGDTHGDFAFVSKACRVAQNNGIKTIIQVGDFGFWDHTPDGVYFLDQLNENARKRGVTWFVLPGNHENYDRLENYEALPGRLQGHDDIPDWEYGSFTTIRTSIYYTGKVNAWKWAGRTFKAVGGAVSIDKEWRTPGKSWWWQEQLRDDELQQAIDIGPTDFLFTHDCPTRAPFKHRLKPDLDSVMHRQKMNKVGQATKAKVWFHGHMHDFYDYWFQYGPKEGNDTKVYGLECNDNAMWNPYGDIKNMAIFDTDTLRVEFPETKGV